MNKIFNDEDELLGYLIEQLDENDNIILAVDYNIAKELSNVYEDNEFTNYYAIDLASDCGEYYVEKYEEESFVVEPARNLGKYLEGDTDKLIVLKNLLSDDLLDSQECEEMEIVELENKSNKEPVHCNCRNCCEECTQGYEEDEDSYYDEQFDLIDTYYELMKDNDFERKAVKQALLEFGQIVLRDFKLDED